jgi:hypothetical protein
VWSSLALLSVSPWVFPDELIYSELAKSIAAGDVPSVRGERYFEFGLAYPLLIAPAWALFNDAELAYTGARVIGGVLMSLTAVPSFVLARRFTSARKAVLVAAVTVAVPSMAYTGILLTEVALYPAFVLALLALVIAAERASVQSQALFFAAALSATAVKTQAGVLFVIYATSVLLLAMIGTRRGVPARSALKPHWRIAAASVLLLVGAGGIAAWSSKGPLSVFGAYETVLRHIDPLETVKWALANFAALDIYLTVVPLIATGVVVATGLTSGNPRRQVYSVVTVVTTTLVLLEVGAFGSALLGGAEQYEAPSSPLLERNLFVISPLFLIGLALFTDDKRRPFRSLVPIALLAVAATALYPWSSAPTGAGPQNLAVVPWEILTRQTSLLVLGTTLWAVCLTLLVFFTPWNRSGRYWIAIAAWFVLAGLFSSLVFQVSAKKSEGWARTGPAAWIDAAVPSDARVAVLWDTRHARPGLPAHRDRIVWVNEFFNESMGTVYALGHGMPYSALPETRVRIAAGREIRTIAGSRITARYVLAPCALGVRGRALAVDREKKMAVFRTDGRLALGGHSACPP